MNKFLKYTLITVAALFVLVAAALAAVAMLVNPNEYKPLVVKAVAEKTQRTLTLDGDIKLALFPKLGLDLGKASLSEHGSKAEFAAVNGVKLYVAWLPLLHKSLVVDEVNVDGARANLVRFADGSSNYDDLLQQKQQPTEESSPLKFDVQGINVSNSAVTFDDRMAGRKTDISQFNMHSGRLKDGVPTDLALDFSAQMDKPQIKADVRMKSGVLFELEQKHYALSGLDLAIKGAAAGLTDLDLSLKGDVDARLATTEFLLKGLALSLAGKQNGNPLSVKLDAPNLQLTQDKVSSDKLTLDAQLQQGKGTVKAVLTLPQLEGNGESFKTDRLTLDVDGQQGDNTIKGTLTSPFAGNLKAQRFDLSRLQANLSVSNPQLPKGKMTLSLSGDAHADLLKEDVAANLATQLDDSHIKAALGMSHFAVPQYRFDVAVDKLDVDRYTSTKTEASPSVATAQAEKPFDLSPLKSLNASGSLKVGALKASNIRLSNLRMNMQAAGGKLAISPLAASLYDGTMDGSVSINASGKPQFAVKETLRGININPLLKDAINKDMLEGNGNVSLDVQTQGNTVTALKKSLAGHAALQLKDGAIKGVNVAAMLRKAKAQMGGGQQTQAASSTEKTDFSELTASFVLHDGVAHNEDLSMKSPLLRLGGNGDINIGDSTMNYLAKATVVGTLQGQGGAELASLKGVTVPVRVAGPFNALKYSVDMNALVSESVKAKAVEKREEVKTKLEDKLKGDLKGLFGK